MRHYVKWSVSFETLHKADGTYGGYKTVERRYYPVKNLWTMTTIVNSVEMEDVTEPWIPDKAGEIGHTDAVEPYDVVELGYIVSGLAYTLYEMKEDHPEQYMAGITSALAACDEGSDDSRDESFQAVDAIIALLIAEENPSEEAERVKKLEAALWEKRDEQE